MRLVSYPNMFSKDEPHKKTIRRFRGSILAIFPRKLFLPEASHI